MENIKTNLYTNKNGNIDNKNTHNKVNINKLTRKVKII